MKFNLIGFIWAIIAALTGLNLSADAQQRQPNAGSQTFLHEWPISGVWQAALARLSPDGRIGCVVLTGYHNPQTGERYLWGLRQRGQQMAVMVIDSNAAAVEGSMVEVVVDGAIVGDFLVVARRTENGFHWIRADLASRDADIIRNLMNVGGNIKFATDNATYSASLAGARLTMRNFYTCLAEARQLNSAQSSASAGDGGSYSPTPR